MGGLSHWRLRVEVATIESAVARANIVASGASVSARYSE